MGHGSPYAIEVDSLRKVFTTTVGFWRRQSKNVLAVEDISFHVKRGELFGILGPNGAGKTTTVKMLSTLLLPTAGQARVLGLDILKDTQKIRQRIGFTFNSGRGLYSRLSAHDNLSYFAELYGLDPHVARRRIPELLELMGLSGREHDRVETFSSGMQQRLHIARALLHNPTVLFLDEPTVGIDPIGSRELRRVIKQLAAIGKTVLLTTHYMFEAEELCDRIAVINQGKIIALDTPTALKRGVSGSSVIDIQVSGKDDFLLERLRPLGERAIIRISETNEVHLISVRTPEPGCVMEVLAPYLKPEFIQSLEVRSPTLEDVYVSLIQKENSNGHQ